MGCTPEAIVCDDTGTSTDVRLLLLEVAFGVVVIALVVLAIVALMRRRPPRRPPVTRVWVSAAGDVVRRELLPAGVPPAAGPQDLHGRAVERLV